MNEHELGSFRTHLPSQQFNHLPNRHPRGKTVRVHDGVLHRNRLSVAKVYTTTRTDYTRYNALIIKRHVLLIHDEATNTLLSMP